MSEQQIPEIAMVMGQLVAHQSGFGGLSIVDRQFVIEAPTVAIKIMTAALHGRPTELKQRAYSFLEPIVPTHGRRRTFRAVDTFFKRNSGVSLKVSSDFERMFRDKVEEDVPEGNLQSFAIAKGGNDRNIIEDLGGEKKAEVTLSEIWDLLERQAYGGNGPLLDRTNIFYVRDCEGVLRTVAVALQGNGWHVRAERVGINTWVKGLRVFARIYES